MYNVLQKHYAGIGHAPIPSTFTLVY